MATLYKVDGTTQEIKVLGLATLQNAVGGLIEVGWESEDRGQCLLCNEEGLMCGLEYNSQVKAKFGVDLVGDCLLVNCPEEFN